MRAPSSLTNLAQLRGPALHDFRAGPEGPDKKAWEVVPGASASDPPPGVAPAPGPIGADPRKRRRAARVWAWAPRGVLWATTLARPRGQRASLRPRARLARP